MFKRRRVLLLSALLLCLMTWVLNSHATNTEGKYTNIQFPKIEGAAPGSLVLSDIVLIQHLANTQAKLHTYAAGAAKDKMLEYRLCADSLCHDATPFTSSAGSIHNTTYLQLRMHAPAQKDQVALGFVYIGNEALLWSVNTAAPDDVTYAPEPEYPVPAGTTRKTFTTVEDALLGATVISDILHVRHLSRAEEIKVATGGAAAPETLQYRICSDPACSRASAFASAPGTITPESYVQLQMQAPLQEDKVALGFLYLGTHVVTWKIHTGAPLPETLSAEKEDDDYYYSAPLPTDSYGHHFSENGNLVPGTLAVSDIMRVYGVPKGAPVRAASPQGGYNRLEYRLCTDRACEHALPWTSEDGYVENGVYVQLRMQAPAEKNKVAVGFLYIAHGAAMWRIHTGEKPAEEAPADPPADYFPALEIPDAPEAMDITSPTQVTIIPPGRAPIPEIQEPWYAPLEEKEHTAQKLRSIPEPDTPLYEPFERYSSSATTKQHQPKVLSRDMQRRITQEMLRLEPQLADNPDAGAIVQQILGRAGTDIMGMSDTQLSSWIQKQTKDVIPEFKNKMAQTASKTAQQEFARRTEHTLTEQAKSLVTFSSRDEFTSATLTRAEDQWQENAVAVVIEAGKAAAQVSELEFFNHLEVEYTLGGGGLDNYSLLTVQPLIDSYYHQHNVFVQGSYAHEDDRHTANVGIAYRYMTPDKKHLFGVNTFFDYQWPYDHQRMSIGLDYKNTLMGFNVNYYFPLSGWSEINNAYEERPLGGADAEISGRLPFAPEVELFARHFFWDKKSTPVLDPDGSDIWGYDYSAEYTPITFLTLGAGITDDTERDTPELTASLRLNYNFGQPMEDQLSKPSYNLTSVVDRRFEKVRRENKIRVQTRQNFRVTGVIDLVEGTASVTDPNLGIQAAAVGQTIAFGTTITVGNAGAVADMVQVAFGSGAILRIAENSEALIEDDSITLVNGMLQYISGTGGTTTLLAPGTSVALLGTDVELRRSGTVTTLRIRDGSARFTDVTGSATVNSGETAQATDGDGQTPQPITAGAAYTAHLADAVNLLMLAGDPVNSPKAAPYVPAPVTVAGTLLVGQQLTFAVTTTKAITVTGTPQLEFTLGNHTRTASYINGSGTTTLRFTYTLQNTDGNQSDITVTRLMQNGASLTSSTGQPLMLDVTGTHTGVVGSLGPSVVAMSIVGNPTANATSIDYQVTFDEDVQNVDATDFSVNTTGTVAATVGSVVQNAADDYTVTINNITGGGTLSLQLNVVDIQDTDTNTLTIGMAGETHTVIDTNDPLINSLTTPAGSFSTGQTITLTLDSFENLVSNGGATLDLDIGGVARTAVFSALNAGNAEFTYTVQAGDTDANGVEVTAINIPANALEDASGNDLSVAGFALPASTSAVVDTTAPTVASFTASTNAYFTGNTLTITLDATEDLINTSGTPALDVVIGGNTRTATFSALQAGNAVFTYTVTAGDVDADGLSITGITLAANGLEDAAGNDLDTTGLFPDNSVTSVVNVPFPLFVEGDTIAITVLEDSQYNDIRSSLAVDYGNTGPLVTWNVTVPPNQGGTLNNLHGESTAGDGGTIVPANPLYSPQSNFFGTETFTVQATDGTYTDQAAVAITVTPVNDAPSFDTTGQTGDGTIAGFITNINFGPSENSQSVADYIVEVVNDPTNDIISLDILNNGDLVFQTTGLNNFTATARARLADDGGTANGGDDTSSWAWFTLACNNAPTAQCTTAPHVNLEPSFTINTNLISTNGNVPGFVTSVNLGAGENHQTIDRYIVTETGAPNNVAFNVNISNDGRLTFNYSSFGSSNGIETINVQLMDDGGTANGGDDTSQIVSFDIQVQCSGGFPNVICSINVNPPPILGLAICPSGDLDDEDIGCARLLGGDPNNQDDVGVYAGDLPDGNELFARRCDLGMTWDGNNCVGGRGAYAYKNDGNDSPVDNVISGESAPLTDPRGLDGPGMTAALVGAGGHPAAAACDSLDGNWYLPGVTELDWIYSNLVSPDDSNNPRSAITYSGGGDGGSKGGVLANTFDTSGTWTPSYYRTASEISGLYAWIFKFSTGEASYFSADKTWALSVRCARRN